MNRAASAILLLSCAVGSVVGAACASGTSSSSPAVTPADAATSSEGGPVGTPKEREATICGAQRTFDERCPDSAQADGGGACAWSCFAPLMTPAAATAFSECVANQACDVEVCGLAVPCTSDEYCSFRAGKAGLAESGLDVDAFVASCEAKASVCKNEVFDDPKVCDVDRFAAMYGAFAGVPKAVAACFELPCDQIRSCIAEANAETEKCVLASTSK